MIFEMGLIGSSKEDGLMEAKQRSDPDDSVSTLEDLKYFVSIET